MNYDQALAYLESFVNYEKLSNYAYNKAFGLERIKKLLELLGNPQDSLRCIHVAGTKGKGSTCAFIAYVLREAGYKVGLYTSPHLSDFRERIRILGHQLPVASHQLDFEGMISKRDLIRFVEKIRNINNSPLPVGERVRVRGLYSNKSPSSFSSPHRGEEELEKISTSTDLLHDTPTFFEIYTTLAFLYFKEKRVDFAVLETGLGGRLDATNVINPLVSVITPISLEHTQFLGNTLEKIAQEKSGIIKNAPVITAPQEKDVLEVIRNKCKTVGAKLYQPKIDTGLKPRLLGRHQLINASVAKAAIEALQLKIRPAVIRRGIRNTVWPGRCEIISRNPLIVLDGAQNVASTQVLKKAITENFKYKKLIIILGVSSDKDIKGISAQINSFAGDIILTKADNPRAADPKKIAQYFKNKSIYITKSVKEAIRKALDLAGKQDLILITGSLYVVGEARKYE